MTRYGFSLPVVLFAISLGGALAIGGAYVTRQMASSARTLGRSSELDALAQRGAVEAIAGLDSAAVAALTVGMPQTVGAWQSPRARADGWITQVSPGVVWLVVEATSSGKPLLRRRLGAVLTSRDGQVKLVSARAWSDLP
jgi:hypothetical protein